jgi:hypothetical protein
MPFLDAKALETDADGMAFLRSVIHPKSRLNEAARGSPPAAQPQAAAAPSCRVEVQPSPEPSDAPHPLETA